MTLQRLWVGVCTLGIWIVHHVAADCNRGRHWILFTAMSSFCGYAAATQCYAERPTCRLFLSKALSRIIRLQGVYPRFKKWGRIVANARNEAPNTPRR